MNVENSTSFLKMISIEKDILEKKSIFGTIIKK